MFWAGSWSGMMWGGNETSLNNDRTVCTPFLKMLYIHYNSHVNILIPEGLVINVWRV